MYFSAREDTPGRELWRSNGVGKELVKDINPNANSNPDNLTVVEDELFFTADNGVDGVELWRSDGTADGTELVRDINPSGDSSPTSLTNVNGTLFFVANDGSNGPELWKSDGTGAGTELVTDLNPNDSTAPSSLVNVNGTLFFAANDGVNGTELWKSDGTENGTFQVADINGLIESSNPAEITPFNGQLIMSASDPDRGAELWSATLQGDFVMDGLVDISDLDALVAEIVAGNDTPDFDLNTDGVVNQTDLQMWLELAGNCNLGFGRTYLLGDANLNGTVDEEDFVVWNENKFTTNPGWSSADFNADGVVDGQDFIMWNTYKFTDSDAAASAALPPSRFDLNSAEPLSNIELSQGRQLVDDLASTEDPSVLPLNPPILDPRQQVAPQLSERLPRRANKLDELTHGRQQFFERFEDVKQSNTEKR